MNSSRFGGFRTADGASQGSKAQHNHYQIGQDQMTHGDAHGPQSPSSNKGFRMNVENRRARPKIVKASQDHGNMFFIQQANSMKNSSQIPQRKDMHHKINPYNMLQSRGGDTVSQGGTTNATTAIGNQDLSYENRSGHSGNDRGIQNSNSNNAFGDASNKSISDRERTPTNKSHDGY